MIIDSSILDKIAGLFQLAEKNSNPHESAAAASAAQALLTKHRLTRADLDAREAKAETVGEAEDPLYTGKRKVAWKEQLAIAICETNGCRMFWRRSRISKNWDSNRSTNLWRICLIGRESDIQVVRYLYAYLEREIERLTQDRLSTGELRGKTESNSFKLGALQSVVAKLYDGQQQAKEEAKLTSGGSQAIVKLDAVEAEVEEYYKTLKLGKPAARYIRMNRSAFNNGQQAGRNISIHQGIGGKNAPKGLTSG